jgi:hypothetical protein
LDTTCPPPPRPRSTPPPSRPTTGAATESGIIRDAIRYYLRDVKKQDGKFFSDICAQLTRKYLKGKDSLGMFSE